MTDHLGKCCKQAYALFSKEHNPRAPRFQCGGRDRGAAASLRRLWQTLGSRREDYEILSSCRLRRAACPIEHVAVAFWVETPGLSSERLERSLRWLKCSAGQAGFAKPVPADKPRQALFTTHASMMAQVFRWPSSFRKACSGRQAKTSSVHNANQDKLCSSRPGSQPANPGGRRGGDHNLTYNLTYNSTLNRM